MACGGLGFNIGLGFRSFSQRPFFFCDVAELGRPTLSPRITKLVQSSGVSLKSTLDDVQVECTKRLPRYAIHLHLDSVVLQHRVCCVMLGDWCMLHPGWLFVCLFDMK